MVGAMGAMGAMGGMGAMGAVPVLSFRGASLGARFPQDGKQIHRNSASEPGP